jgi:hypothetical protein
LPLISVNLLQIDSCQYPCPFSWQRMCPNPNAFRHFITRYIFMVRGCWSPTRFQAEGAPLIGWQPLVIHIWRHVPCNYYKIVMDQ